MLMLLLRGRSRLGFKKSIIKTLSGKSVVVSSNRDNSKFILLPYPGATYYSIIAERRLVTEGTLITKER